MLMIWFFFADNLVKMNKLLVILEKYCKENKLTVNIKKIKIMIIRKGGFNNNKYIFTMIIQDLKLLRNTDS